MGSDDVGTDDAPAVLHRLRERVEVAPLARDAVRADEDAVAGATRALPLPIRQAMQAAAVEALHVTQERVVEGHRRHFIWMVPLTVAVTSALPGSTDKASAELALVVERRAIAIGIACWSLLETLTSRTAYAA